MASKPEAGHRASWSPHCSIDEEARMAENQAGSTDGVIALIEDLRRRMNTMYGLFVFIVAFGWLVRHFVENAPNAVRVVILLFFGGLLAFLIGWISWPKHREASLKRLGRFEPWAALAYAAGVLVAMLLYFAGLTFVLVDEGWLAFAPNPPRAEMMGRLTDFYGVRLVDAIPGLGLADTLRLSTPLEYRQSGIGILVLAFQVAVIAPIVATVRTFWRTRTEPVDRGRVPRESFHWRLAHHRSRLDKGSEHLDPGDVGLPAVNPDTLVRALLCMTHDRTSDQESARRTRVDPRWRAAMRVGRDFAGIDAMTLAVSRLRMLLRDADRDHFKDVLRSARKAGIFTDPLEEVLGSSAVDGRRAVEAGCALLSLLLAQAGEGPGWADPAAGEEPLDSLVARARTLIAMVRPDGPPGSSDALALLAAVLADPVAPARRGGARRWRRSDTPRR